MHGQSAQIQAFSCSYCAWHPENVHSARNISKIMYATNKRTRISNRNSVKKGGARTNKSNISTLEPHLFVKKAMPLMEVVYTPNRQILDLPVHPKLIHNLTIKGFKHPTEIQDRTIECILSGKDVLGIAQTGTGKTGAFLVPIIHQLLESKPAFQVLIVVPTRELAVQINEEFKSIAKGLSLTSSCFVGGTNIYTDKMNLRRPSHVVIGTPGRLNDLSRQRLLHYKQFTTLVLDEFDRLLDMGFSNDIQYMVQSMTTRKQTILFSATEEKNQRKLIDNLLTSPEEVRVSQGNVTADHVDQDIVLVKDGEKKMDILLHMIRDKSFEKVIVFAETKRGVSLVCKNLQLAGVRADAIHGDKSQNYRLKALNDFKAGKIQVLIATDVAARGLDIAEVTHVINYQQPKSFDSYIHRIGRTGRAGKSGKAFTFVN
jgi:ATP-dependent RNA helicase RhlE